MDLSVFHDKVLQTHCSLNVALYFFNLSSRNCLLILQRRLFLDGSSLFDLGLIQSWRYAVENIDETYSTLCKICCPVEETTKMTRHAALPVHQRSASRPSYYC